MKICLFLRHFSMKNKLKMNNHLPLKGKALKYSLNKFEIKFYFLFFKLKKEVELLHFKIDEIKSILVEMLENTKRKTKNQVWPTEVVILKKFLTI